PGPGEVKAKILVCHGAADQFIPDEAIVNFKKEMEEASADFEFVDYQWALHGFTNPAADERGKAFNLPLAYDEKADLQSWQAMESHFEKVF
ncbi:MAG TPA: dienelactone hydrolase family protein, partial [SAR324 cluster bacterium]|nr:dienelactone hydrolase family protein [SAR324 cluster bacterium]